MDIPVFTVRASGCLALVVWFVCRHKCGRFHNSHREQLKLWIFHYRKFTSKWVSSRTWFVHLFHILSVCTRNCGERNWRWSEHEHKWDAPSEQHRWLIYFQFPERSSKSQKAAAAAGLLRSPRFIRPVFLSFHKYVVVTFNFTLPATCNRNQ